jgi:hypothetical protein
MGKTLLISTGKILVIMAKANIRKTPLPPLCNEPMLVTAGEVRGEGLNYLEHIGFPSPCPLPLERLLAPLNCTAAGEGFF